MNLADSKFTNIMLDIETTDKRPTSAILQIACAVMGAHELSFPFEGTVGTNHAQPGRTISLDTMQWWMDDGRRDAAKQVWQADGNTLPVVLANLADHLNTIKTALGKPLRIWSKGPVFDMGILQHAYDQQGQEFPETSFREFKCYRTVADIYPSLTAKTALEYYQPKELDLDFAPHSAYGDVVRQGFHLMYIVERANNYAVVEF